MNRCPKCSGWMSGPRYRRLGWGGEVLEYRCDCGYTEQKPPHDTEAKPKRGPEYGCDSYGWPDVVGESDRSR